jgi:hypothetical protein
MNPLSAIARSELKKFAPSPRVRTIGLASKWKTHDYPLHAATQCRDRLLGEASLGPAIHLESFTKFQQKRIRPDNGQRGELNMQDPSSTEVKRRRGWRRRDATPWVETVGGKLRVWRDQSTNEIVIEPPIVAPAEKRNGLITLSARHARHLANSLFIFAAETESSSTFTAAMSPIQVAQNAEENQ